MRLLSLFTIMLFPNVVLGCVCPPVHTALSKMSVTCISLSQGSPLVVHRVPLCPLCHGGTKCWHRQGHAVGHHGGCMVSPVPWGQGKEWTSAFHAGFFGLEGGDAWREIADDMESTPVVRGSGGMPPPPPPPPPPPRYGCSQIESS